MYDYRKALRAAISSEAKAYGFTITVWTTGALTAAERGGPDALSALAYLAGIGTAMGVVILATFGGVRETWTGRRLRRFAYGAVHVVSVAVAVGLGWGAALAIRQPQAAFAVSGFVATLAFQLVLGLEIAVSVAGPSDGSPPPPSGRGP